MKQRDRGAISGLAIGLIAVVIIAIIGIGWMWKKGGIVASGTSQLADTSAGIPDTGTDTGYTYTIATSSTASTATTPLATETHTVTTYETRTVPIKETTIRPAAPAYTGISGSTYHNSTYGLTLRLPSAGWTTYMTAGGPASLPGTAQIHFIAPGESQDALVINVWSKVGWNYVRTNENFVHLNTDNIGEGTYLGENFTWIYSYTIYSHAPEAQASLNGAIFY